MKPLASIESFYLTMRIVEGMFIIIRIMLIIVISLSVLPLYFGNTNLMPSILGQQYTIDDTKTDILLQILSDSLKSRLEKAAAILEVTSNLPSINEGVPDEVLLNETLEDLHGIPRDADTSKRKVAQDILSKYNDFELVAYIMPNGDMYFTEPYHIQANYTRNNFAIRDYFKGAVDTNATYLGEAYISAGTGNTGVTIALPIWYSQQMNGSNDASLIGIWEGDLNLQLLDDFLQDLNLTNNERIVIADRSGLKLADSNKTSANTTESFSNLQSFNDALTSTEEKPGSVIEIVNGTEFLTSYYPVRILSSTWVILFMQPADYLIEDNSNITTSSILI